MMTKEDKIFMLEARKNNLEAKGMHNIAIVKKLIRKIRLLQNNIII